MSTASMANAERVSRNMCIVCFWFCLTVLNGCGPSNQDVDEQQRKANDQPVEISSIAESELKQHLGKIVRFQGTPIEGKVVGDLETKFGRVFIAGGANWPDAWLGQSIEIEGRLAFYKPELEPEETTEFVVPQMALPDPALGGWYMIEDAKIIVDSIKDRATVTTGEDPFGGF